MLGEKCFLIEEKELYMKTLLVEYDYVPLFYICVDNNNDYYTVLRRNFTEETYIVVKNKTEHIIQMLENKITMRQLLTIEDFFWNVIAGDDISSDIIEKKEMSEIPVNDLPLENAYYGEATPESVALIEELNFSPCTKDNSSVEMTFDMFLKEYEMIVSYKKLSTYEEKECSQTLTENTFFTEKGYIPKEPKTTEQTANDNIKYVEDNVGADSYTVFAA